MTKGKLIAEVNGQLIYEWQLIDTMAGFSREVLKKDLSMLTPTEYNESKEEALDKLIGSELLYLEAIGCGYNASDDKVEEVINSFKNSLSSDYTFQDYLQDRGILEEDFRELVRKQLIKEEFVAAIMSRIPVPTDKDAESYYEKVKGKLCYPPRFNFFVCYISDPSDDEREKFKNALINLANKKIEKTFAETIMKDVNQIVNRASFVNYEKGVEELPLEFKDMLLKIEESCFSPIFESNNEISIVYLIKKEINKPLSEEEGKEEAKRYLSIIRIKKVLDAYIDSLKDKYTVKVFA